MPNGEIILYTSEGGRSKVQLRTAHGTIWLTQLEMADLFQTTKQNISLHIKNILEEREQDSSVVKEHLTTASDGKNYKTKLYNLNMILSVGYRVASPRGIQFRQWATTHLQEYLVKGFVMDDARLKEPQGGIISMSGFNVSGRFELLKSGSIRKCAIFMPQLSITIPRVIKPSFSLKRSKTNFFGPQHSTLQ